MSLFGFIKHFMYYYVSSYSTYQSIKFIVHLGYQRICMEFPEETSKEALNQGISYAFCTVEMETLESVPSLVLLISLGICTSH